MLISFSVENWMSYRDKVTFSMVAGEQQQFEERLSLINNYNIRVLPMAAMYGGNASGKSNFLSALNFVKNFIVKVTQPDSSIDIEPFALDAQYAQRPTCFAMQILVNEEIYEFSFAVTREKVMREKLVKALKNSEEVLYERIEEKINCDNIAFTDQTYPDFVSKSTPNNQLFLTHTLSLKVQIFKHISDWFKNTLKLVNPQSAPSSILDQIDSSHPSYITMNNMLGKLDTGIVHLKFEDVPPRSLPTRYLLQDVENGRIINFGDIIITRQSGKLKAKKLVTYHLTSEGEAREFGIERESHGSRRLIELLPAFLQLSNSNIPIVFAIDELDNSLHTLLTRALIEDYLASCGPENLSQLLFTTHDVSLMKKDLLRTDEMWLMQRKPDGATTLYSADEYEEAESDDNIGSSYLQGRLGGIPNIFLNGELRELKEKEVEE